MAEKTLMLILGALLLICAIQDLFKKRVYLWVIGIGAALTFICLPFLEKLSIADCIGGLTVGLITMLISKMTAGKIGMGDGILLCVTGIGLGFWNNLELFGIALFLAAVLSILLLLSRIVDRKKSIPFIPFLFAGYLIIVFASKGALV
jgi:leader peptidase (prepilin peptidase)/N-methyltransferase